MSSENLRTTFNSILAFPGRMLGYYSGPVRNSIEYWQRYIFYVISFIGVVAGTLCLVPTCILFSRRGQYLETGFIIAIYAVNVAVIFFHHIKIKHKAAFIAFGFYLFGLVSLIIAGPEGESGIWFTVSVLMCSLFIGLKASLLVAVVNFLTGISFGVLHAKGLIGWDILVNFRFPSWVLQSGNIFFMDTMFAIANAVLLRGVDSSFMTLNAAEARIRDSLEEKETLIREIHHRSKNNMQVVSSLLTLHSIELGEEKAKTVFKDVINKIASMALVHQKLYESRDLSNINMADYIEELVALLMRSYKVTSGKIEANFQLQDISLPIDSAIPCGLVISELVTNSLKYAFPSDRKGRIDVILKDGADGFFDLEISDDGVGAGGSFDPGTMGKMGLKTVFTIVQHQMQGNIRFLSHEGFSFHIRFPRNAREGRIQTHG